MFVLAAFIEDTRVVGTDTKLHPQDALLPSKACKNRCDVRVES